MPVNGSELIDAPFDTVFSPFTGLLGSAFWLVPISIIAAALFVKTKNVTMVGAWLLGAGMLMGGADIFAGFPGMFTLYGAIIIVGILAIIAGIIMQRKGG